MKVIGANWLHVCTWVSARERECVWALSINRCIFQLNAHSKCETQLHNHKNERTHTCPHTRASRLRANYFRRQTRCECTIMDDYWIVMRATNLPFTMLLYPVYGLFVSPSWHQCFHHQRIESFVELKLKKKWVENWTNKKNVRKAQDALSQFQT